MDLSFSVDFDAAEVYAVIDNSLRVTVIQDGDEYRYKNFDRIDDENLQDKIKIICKLLLTLDDE